MTEVMEQPRRDSCGICKGEGLKLRSPGCGHFACRDCWTQRVEEAIGAQMKNPLVFITCFQCVCALNEGFLSGIVQITPALARKISRRTSNLVQLFTENIPKVEGAKIQLDAASATDFWHYRCDADDDDNWGCAYRCLQMLLSNLTIAKHLQVDEMPTLYQMQLDLAAYGDIKQTDIGTHKWIEPPNAASYLLHKHNVKSEQHVFYQGKEKTEQLFDRCALHFRTHKTPIMIDDTIQAFVLVAACVIEAPGQPPKRLMLRFDPHENHRHEESEFVQLFKEQLAAKEASDALPPLLAIAGVWWMDLNEVFANRFKTGKWLMCFPTPK